MVTEKKIKPHYHGHRERLKERYKKGGVDALADYEALELLLTFAIPTGDVKPLAKELLRKFNSIQGVLDATSETLMEVKGVGKHTSVLLNIVKDIGSLYLRHKQVHKKTITNTVDIIDYLRSIIGSSQDEQFLTFFLNASNEVTAEEVITIGTINHATVYPRKILEAAIKYKALRLILVHNHPGGSLDPSYSDITLTSKLKSMSNLFDIEIYDHIIVTSSGYMSFREKRIL
ncbi:MAG: DNA repair protein RadC [Nitrospirae bacterium]|nr:DNA repair protein RadC [Nitrospirota bacterium]